MEESWKKNHSSPRPSKMLQWKLCSAVKMTFFTEKEYQIFSALHVWSYYCRRYYTFFSFPILQHSSQRVDDMSKSTSLKFISPVLSWYFWSWCEICNDGCTYVLLLCDFAFRLLYLFLSPRPPPSSSFGNIFVCAFSMSIARAKFRDTRYIAIGHSFLSHGPGSSFWISQA